MEDHSSATYRETAQKESTQRTTKTTGRNVADASLKPGSGDSEAYNKVHHDLDVAAAHRKPIVTESKYKVKVAEPELDELDHHHHHHDAHHGEGKSSEKTVKKESQQKGQFIAKPDVYGKTGRGKDEDEEGDQYPWAPVLGAVAAIAGVIAGVMFYRKRNPDADAKFRRSVEGADHRVKGAIGSGERKVKELFGSGQQKLNNLIHRGGDHHDDGISDDEDHYDSRDRRGRGHNAFGGTDYQVKKGDNLTKIAKNSGKESWQDIAAKNPSIRNPDLIYAGDHLKV